MSSLFLSYSRKDAEFVRLLADDLKGAQVKIWIDEGEIKGGQSLLTKIGDALSTVEYVAVCLSPDSVSSNWVIKEINVSMAMEIKEKRDFVIPLLIKDCKMPPLLIDKTYIDLREPARYESEFCNLLLRVKPDAVSESRSPLPIFTVDVNRKERLLETAGKLGMKDWVIDYLVEAKHNRADPSERHWIYVALGEIGGEKAMAAVREGLSDESEFARIGAQWALRMMSQSDLTNMSIE